VVSLLITRLRMTSGERGLPWSLVPRPVTLYCLSDIMGMMVWFQLSGYEDGSDCLVGCDGDGGVANNETGGQSLLCFIALPSQRASAAG
jgi:hypothetical protein